MTELDIGGKLLRLVMGDITKEKVGAIVNAANTRLAGGGGVDGAIHRAGGPSIMAECDAIRADRGGCPTGGAVATTAGNLDARCVIHTAGPVWRGGGRGETLLLAQSYSNCMALTEEMGCRTVAFPSISTGAYMFPIDKAARIALETVSEELEKRDIDEARFVLFSKSDLDIYSGVLAQIAEERT